MLFLRFAKSKRLRLLVLILSLSLATGIYVGVSSGRDLTKESYLNSITNSLGYTDFVIKGNETYFFTFDNFEENLTINPYIAEYEPRIQFWCRASYLSDFSSYTYLYLSSLQSLEKNKFGKLNIIAGDSKLTANDTIVSSLVADLLDLQINDTLYVQIRTLAGVYETIKLNISGIANLNNKVIDFDKDNPDRFWAVDKVFFLNLTYLQEIIGDERYTHVYVHTNDFTKITDAYKIMNETLTPFFSICSIKEKMLSDVEITVDNITKLIDVTYVMGFALSIFVLVDILYEYLFEWKYYIGVLKTLGVSNTRIFLDLSGTIFIVSLISSIFGIPIAQLSFILILQFSAALIGTETHATYILNNNTNRIYEGVILNVSLSLVVCSAMLLVFLRKNTIITLLGREKRIRVASPRFWKILAVVTGGVLSIVGNYVLETFMPEELGAENLNIAFIGIITLMIGLAIALTPIVIKIPAFFSRTRIPPFTSKFGILATRNLKRNYWRTFFAIIIITFTISFIIGGYAIFNSFYGAIRTSSYLTVGSDISVEGSLPVNLTSKILNLKGVSSVTGIKISWRQTFCVHNKNATKVNVYGINATTFFRTIFEVKLSGDKVESQDIRNFQNLLEQRNDTILIQKELLDFLNISIGDNITWKTRNGDINLTVVGTIDLMAGAGETLWKDYSIKSNVYMAITNIKLLFSIYGEMNINQQKVNKFLIKTNQKSNSTVILQNIKSILKESKVIPYRIRNVNERIQSLMQYYTPFFGLFQILMSSFIFLSSFSIIANFAYIVIERRYEFAILRSLGFSRSDLMKLIIFESFLEVTLAGILGIIIGVFAIQHLFNLLPYSSIFPLSYSLPLISIFLSLLLTFSLTTVSSIVPIYHLVGNSLISSVLDYEKH